jgi:5-methyltetrahydropteroyltriglutamate--homocysteine methyltransferase
MKRSENRILTTHVGSLIRPAELLDALRETADGSPARDGRFITILEQAINDVVRRQAEAGIDIINDGEFGKSSWANYILERISGFENRPNQKAPVHWLGRDPQRFDEFFAKEMPFLAEGLPVDACTGSIAYADPVPVDLNIRLFKQALNSVSVTEAFLTTVAPASAAFTGVNEFYPSEHDYVFALAEALREEYKRVHDAGLLVQVDDAVLANMYDFLVQQSPERYREWAELRVEALNYALREIPEDGVRYHICFGSWHVPHVADAPLSEMVDLILRVRAGAYSIEAANPRHEHEWRVWKDVKLPPGKILIPGVITHHTTTVEHPQVVADRIVRFAEIVGQENVIAGTDCGFAQAQWIQRVHPQVMWAKFESLVEGARLATKILWR